MKIGEIMNKEQDAQHGGDTGSGTSGAFEQLDFHRSKNMSIVILYAPHPKNMLQYNQLNIANKTIPCNKTIKQNQIQMY